jgi:hypothetical protein
MSVHNGKNADVKINSTAVIELSDWSINTTADFITKRAFEDDFTEKYWSGYNWTGSANGWLDLSDAGQLAWFSACISGTQQTTVKFYVDTTGYFSGNCYVTGFSTTASREDLVKVSYTFEGDGALAYTAA